MSVIEYDVVVIGAGVAGLTAGAHLAQNGLKVALVTAGEPTACLSTGCIDLCQTADNPLLAIESLPAEHPYHHLQSASIRQSLEDFQKIMAEKSLLYSGQPEKNRLVLSAIGSFKTTCFVPVTMQASPQSADEKIHIIAFAGLKDFYPGYIISRLKKSSFSIYDAGVSTTMGIAANFENSDFLEAFLLWMEKLGIRENKIALPAVLGLESAPEILKKIENRMGHPVFEIPTIPPSMPGRRLFNALKDHFCDMGGDIYWNWKVRGVEKTSRLIEAVVTDSPGAPNSINARAFILATGSFVGGGLHARRNALVEQVFNLPVFTTGERESWFNQDYFSASHNIGKAGITIDSSFRPMDCRWDNIFVGGSILAHAEALKNGCGHGLAIATGQAAASACWEYLQ